MGLWMGNARRLGSVSICGRTALDGLVLTDVESNAAVDFVTLLRTEWHIIGIHESIAHVSEGVVHGLEVLESVGVPGRRWRSRRSACKGRVRLEGLICVWTRNGALS